VKFLIVLCIAQVALVFLATWKHPFDIQVTIRERNENETINEWASMGQYLHVPPVETKKIPPELLAVETPIPIPVLSDDPVQGRIKNAQQCNRDYGSAINFVDRYPTITDCPSLPHVSLALGKRITVHDDNINSANNITTSMFLPKDCQFKWFQPEEACDLIGSLGMLYFDGDSLIRQLLVALGAVLDGNFRTGGLSLHTSKEQLEACQCEKSWQCWKESTHRFTERDPQYGLCPKWTRNHVWVGSLQDFQEQYCHHQRNQSSTTNTPLIVIGNGNALHRQLEFRNVYQHMDILRRVSTASGGTIIPMTVHWPGPNKPVPYRLLQGYTAVQRYNQELRHWSLYYDLWLLETYQLTKDMWSRDGTHYDDDNILLVQVLLNQLWYLQLNGKLAVVAEQSNDPNDPSNFRIGRPEDVHVETNHGPVPRPY